MLANLSPPSDLQVEAGRESLKRWHSCPEPQSKHHVRQRYAHKRIYFIFHCSLTLERSLKVHLEFHLLDSLYSLWVELTETSSPKFRARPRRPQQPPGQCWLMLRVRGPLGRRQCNDRKWPEAQRCPHRFCLNPGALFSLSYLM